MSTETSNFNRLSVCATCLRQDRKLIAITDSHASTLSYLELSLSLSDMICWECHSFVQRMAKFKSRAQKAQECLWDMTNGLQRELPNLSPLTTSTGVSVDIPSEPSDIKPEPQELMEVMIKQEFDKDKLRPKDIPSLPSDASTSTSYKQEAPQPSRGVPVSARVTATADSGPALVKQADENDDIDMIDGAHDKADVEMSVISHVVAAEAPANKSKGRKKPGISDISRTKVVNSGSDQWIYTEKVLSEEEMVQWRQAKAKTEHFRRSIPPERCESCIEVFDNERVAKAHAQRHTESYGDVTCAVCRQRAVDARALAAHTNRHYRLLTCQYCPFAWDDANTLRRHAGELHDVPQAVWDCDLCERQYTSLKRLQLHAKRHRSTKCRVCGQHVAEQAVARHMLLHSEGVTWATCAECGGRYRGAGALRAHMLTHRTQAEDSTYCAECNTHFKSRFHLGMHMRNGKHATEDDYRFACDHCGKKFLSAGLLRRHVDVHGDVPYPCPQCRKVYKTRVTLRVHVRLVHERKARRRSFICDHCGKTFTAKGILQDHINSHTGARPYMCTLCGDTFGYKSALYLHGRYKHRIQKKNNDNKNIEDTEEVNKPT